MCVYLRWCTVLPDVARQISNQAFKNKPKTSDFFYRAPLGSGERKIQKLCPRFYNLCGWIVNWVLQIANVHSYGQIGELCAVLQNCTHGTVYFSSPELQDNDHKRELNHLFTYLPWENRWNNKYKRMQVHYSKPPQINILNSKILYCCFYALILLFSFSYMTLKQYVIWVKLNRNFLLSVFSQQ